MNPKILKDIKNQIEQHEVLNYYGNVSIEVNIRNGVIMNVNYGEKKHVVYDKA